MNEEHEEYTIEWLESVTQDATPGPWSMKASKSDPSVWGGRWAEAEAVYGNGKPVLWALYTESDDTLSCHCPREANRQLLERAPDLAECLLRMTIERNALRDELAVLKDHA